MVNNIEAKNREAVKSFIRKAKMMGYKEEDEVVKQSLKEILEKKGSTKEVKKTILEQLLKLKDIIEFNNKEVVLTNDELQKLIDEKVKEAMSSIKDKSEKNINEITEEKIKKILSEQTQQIINDMDVNSNNIININVNVTVNNINLQRESILDKTYNAARETTSKVASWGTKFKENIVKQKNKQIGNVLTFFEKIKDKSKELKDGVKNKIANNIEKRAIKQNEKALEKEQEALRKERELIEKQKILALKQKELAERKRRLAERIRGKDKNVVEEVVAENQEEVVSQNDNVIGQNDDVIIQNDDVVAQNDNFVGQNNEDIEAQNQENIEAENPTGASKETKEDVKKPEQEVSKQEIINLSREIADSYRIDFEAENMEQKVSAEFDRILQNENLENVSNVQAFIMKKVEGLYKIHNIEFMEAQREARKEAERKSKENIDMSGQPNSPKNTKNNEAQNGKPEEPDVKQAQNGKPEEPDINKDGDNPGQPKEQDANKEVFDNRGPEDKEPIVDQKEKEVTDNTAKENEEQSIEDIDSFVLKEGNSGYKYEKKDGKFTRTYITNGKEQRTIDISEEVFNRKREDFLKTKSKQMETDKNKNPLETKGPEDLDLN